MQLSNFPLLHSIFRRLSGSNKLPSNSKNISDFNFKDEVVHKNKNILLI